MNNESPQWLEDKRFIEGKLEALEAGQEAHARQLVEANGKLNALHAELLSYKRVAHVLSALAAAAGALATWAVNIWNDLHKAAGAGVVLFLIASAAGAQGGVHGDTPNACARFDANNKLVAAAGDCPSGDTGGGGNTFETINAPSGTDPVADSSTDTLNVTCSGGLTCTGDSGTDTIDLVVGNVATATALAANPAPCSLGDFVTDIAANGTLTCATPSGGSGLPHPQVMARLAVGGGY